MHNVRNIQRQLYPGLTRKLKLDVAVEFSSSNARKQSILLVSIALVIVAKCKMGNIS